MQAPRIELITSKPNACSDASVALDVLIRITPPLPEVHFPRPPLNLGLVLDRSGSMAEGRKMSLAQEAAAFAVEQLLPEDRLSVTVYDSEIDVIVPSALVSNKPDIIQKIRATQPRGSTDLFGGWSAGAQQVLEHHAASGLNRVLLLTDGLANAGVVDPNAIEGHVKEMSEKGVSTTTLGVGDHYNEDLLERMARASDGNYYYVQSPVQLADLFQTELQGLMASVGIKVSLGVEPAEGVRLVEVLNDLECLPTGRFKLANLIVGMPQSIVVRLNVGPRTSAGPLCAFRLAWNDPKRPDRQSRRVTIDSRAPISKQDWDAQPIDPSVAEQVALLMAARAQREAAAALDRGDLPSAVGHFDVALSYCRAVPSSDFARRELAEILENKKAAEDGDRARSSRAAKYMVYRRRLSRPAPDKPGQGEAPAS